MRYRISDTGIGMSEEFTKEVFEEFAQEDSDVRTQYHGAGLGMAIVKKYEIGRASCRERVCLYV